MNNFEPWYKEKISLIFSEIFGGIFSLSFLKAIFSSFAYFLHEQVIWRKKIHHKGDYRIHARALYAMLKIFIWVKMFVLQWIAVYGQNSILK